MRWLLCQWKAGNDLDMHWTPVVNFCTPCQVRFDVIAKFETLHVSDEVIITGIKDNAIYEQFVRFCAYNLKESPVYKMLNL